ncbi:hypothetical protein PHJA_001471400 [Phtheirospermum japonicum]|uniref:Uncharacterized protein n=1 Tax=Phtheirospermum japonicum TaxID=374723 RepID=A0A830C0T2_9LAMI|nr:hypothetical protein PHJA_001471400 [Phtheirospermum japonicum]
MDDISRTKPPKEDDALSLSSSTEAADDKKHSSHKAQDKRRSSSEPSDFFEFFTSGLTADTMSHAEDIIFRGKLVPFRNHHHHFLKSLSADDATRRSNSLTSRSYPEGRALRRRDWMRPDAARNIRRSFSKRSKPKWFVLMFGPLKLQPEMDLREMKIRRGRRSPGSMFPPMEAAGGDIPVGRSGRRSFWGFDLLRVLSCKSVAVKSRAHVTVT